MRNFLKYKHFHVLNRYFYHAIIWIAQEYKKVEQNGRFSIIQLRGPFYSHFVFPYYSYVKWMSEHFSLVHFTPKFCFEFSHFLLPKRLRPFHIPTKIKYDFFFHIYKILSSLPYCNLLQLHHVISQIMCFFMYHLCVENWAITHRLT